MSGPDQEPGEMRLLVYDLVHAARSRAELAPGDRELFWPFFDEMQSYDRDLLDTPEVSIRLCLAEDLAEAGLFEPIFTDYRDPERPTDWLVEETGV